MRERDFNKPASGAWHDEYRQAAMRRLKLLLDVNMAVAWRVVFNANRRAVTARKNGRHRRMIDDERGLALL